MPQWVSSPTPIQSFQPNEGGFVPLQSQIYIEREQKTLNERGIQRHTTGPTQKPKTTVGRGESFTPQKKKKIIKTATLAYNCC